MKHLLIGCVLSGLLAGSCHNTTTTSSSPTTDTGSTPAAATNNASSPTGKASTSAGADTVLWVGKPARYIERPDFILDGKYDSLNHLFIACGSSTPQPIDNASLIAYDDVSNCDTSFTNTIRYFRKPANGAPLQLINLTVAPTPGQLVAHEPVLVTNGTQTMTVRPQDMERIRAAAVLHVNRINQRQIMLRPVH